MRRYILTAIACSAFVWSIALNAGIASAAGSNPLTLTVTPTWFLSTISDGQAQLPPGIVPLNSPQPPRATNNLRWDYGLTYQLDKHSSLSYSHANFDFTLGRILTIAPGTSLETGGLEDRIDTIGYNYGFGHGLNASVYYLSHQRSYVAGLCLNQMFCPGPTGGSFSNPNSINMNAWGVGVKYAFGPVSKYTGPLLTVTGDAQYVPRPSTNPTASLNGLSAYKGSQWIGPYGITLNIPIPNNYGVIPFVDYKREMVLFRGESTPEIYNVVEFGIVKVLRPNLTLAVVNTNWRGCTCTETVPPPDNVRFTDVITSLSYSFKP